MMVRVGRRTLLHFVLAGTLLLRGLIAPGYMPEGDGSVGMRLCPAGLGASLAPRCPRGIQRISIKRSKAMS